MRQNKTGFTLIELSIVLVIIGLIVGGVLVGRDLIKAAEIRAQISQIEKTSTAVNTFRTKYNGIPGDLASAASFGFTARSGAATHGDGDGQIMPCDLAPSNAQLYTFGCETALFWSDLSKAGLISGSFTAATDAPATSLAAADMARYMPTSSISRGAYVSAFTPIRQTVMLANCKTALCYGITTMNGTDGSARFVIPETSSPDTGGNPAQLFGATLTPQQAYNIDNKMDDGYPASGSVLGGFGDNNVQVDLVSFDYAIQPGVCLINRGTMPAPKLEYNVAGAFGTAISCTMTFQQQ